MGVVNTEFEHLEQQLLEIIAEFKLLSTSERRLREVIRTEAIRAEAAEAAVAAAERASTEARNSAAAASASATHAATELASTHEQLTTVKMQLELSERNRTLSEEKCAELLQQNGILERELQQLRPLQSTRARLQRQYTELQERITAATEEAHRETSRLESELRRVEKCAAGGSEIRDRARLAAATHSRERRLVAAELQHTTEELHAANAEIMKLLSRVAELQLRLEQQSGSRNEKFVNPDPESLEELRAGLEAERAGTEKLEKALAAALADNASLATQLRATETTAIQVQPCAPSGNSASISVCPIDSFIADEV